MVGDTQVMSEKVSILKEMDMENLAPVGPSVIQGPGDMHTEVTDTHFAGILRGTNIVLETWYHDKDGSISSLPVFDHNHYANKIDKDGKPFGYTLRKGESPTEEWQRRQIGKEKCPIVGCEYMIPVSYTVDEAITAQIGLKPIDTDKQRRAATLFHIKSTHPNTWSAFVSSGQLTKSEIDELGK